MYSSGIQTAIISPAAAPEHAHAAVPRLACWKGMFLTTLARPKHRQHFDHADLARITSWRSAMMLLCNHGHQQNMCFVCLLQSWVKGTCLTCITTWSVKRNLVTTFIRRIFQASLPVYGLKSMIHVLRVVSTMCCSDSPNLSHLKPQGLYLHVL